ncbi:hypothetical protein IUM83_19975, partial [Phytophthora cinnamomi]
MTKGSHRCTIASK